MEVRHNAPGKPFVLVCGCPRSGTYLLARELRRVLSIAIPTETHFIPHFARFLRLWQPLTQPHRRDALSSAIRCYLRMWINYGWRPDDPHTVLDDSLLQGLEEPVAETTFGDMLHEFYARFAASRGCLHYGDKSSPYDPEDPERYIAAIPNAYVIHIVRDGRDVALSWMATWFGPRRIGDAAIQWQRHLACYRRWGMRHPTRFLEIRYEDLLTDPSAVLTHIANFLDLPRTVTASAAERHGMSNETTHRKIGEAIDPHNLGRWRTDMTARDRETFEALAGNELRASAYDCTTPARTGASRGPLVCAFHVRRLFSWQQLRRRLRRWLPLALGIAQRGGLKLDNLCPLAREREG